MSHDDLPVTPPEEDESDPTPPAPQEDAVAEPASAEDLERPTVPSEDEAGPEREDQAVDEGVDEDEDLTPPAIIAEIPVGGVPRPASPPPPPLAATAPQPDVPSGPAEPEEMAEPRDAAPAESERTVPPAAGEGAAAPAAPPTPAEPEAPPEPAPAPPEPPTSPSRPTEPKPLFSSETLTRPEDWDEELSPELAAVLFGSSAAADEAPAEAAPEPAAEAPSADVAEATPRAATPAVAPAPVRAEAVHLTDLADAPRLPITAQGVTSPAPEVRPEGRVRYVRIEEPFGDKGRRIKEEWDYQGPDRPTLNGRTLRKVKRGEVQFADGSWLWRFERRYTDRSYDRRTVRVNSDRTYVEREDEIKAPDRTTGKRTRRRESEAMILASPAAEPKARRGLLARLFRREEEKAEPRGPQTWRPAAPDEVRRARRQGGAAF